MAKRIQYQRLAYVRIDSAVVETITLDKWFQAPVVPMHRWTKKLREQHFSIDANQLTQKEGVSVDKVSSVYPARIWDRKRLQYLYPSFFPSSVETDQHKKWSVNYPDRVPDRKRNQYLYPSLFMNPGVIVQAETVSVDKTPSVYPARVWDKPRNQYLYPSFFSGRQETEIAIKWSVSYPNKLFDQKRLQYAYPSLFIDPSFLTQAERSTPDKWFPMTPSLLFKAPKNQYLYPPFVLNPFIIVPEIVTMDKWFVQHFRQAVRYFTAPHLYPSFFIDPTVLQIQEAISMGSWWRQTEIPRFDKERNQWMYPSLFMFPGELLQQSPGAGYPQVLGVRSTKPKWTTRPEPRLFTRAVSKPRGV